MEFSCGRKLLFLASIIDKICAFTHYSITVNSDAKIVVRDSSLGLACSQGSQCLQSLDFRVEKLREERNRFAAFSLQGAATAGPHCEVHQAKHDCRAQEGPCFL